MYSKVATKINSFDTNILLFIQRRVQNKFLDTFMPIVTALGNIGVIWIIIAAGLMMDKPYKDVGEIVLITLIISTILGEGIVKHIVRRARPFTLCSEAALLITKPISYSFPSGHTLSSFAVSGVLSVYFTQYRFVFLAIAFLIALSRLYLYVHYPTDVIAGIIFGLLCSKLIFIILQENYLQKIVFLYRNLL